MLHIKKNMLNDGLLLPMLAYGTATAIFQQDCGRWVKMAYLESDMAHFDCAECYGNEDSLGKAVKELGLPREEVIVVTKCNTPDPRKALERSLVKYVQETGLGKAWKMMEELRNEGKARSIGVSNYRVSDLEETLNSTKVIPSSNQIEVHPYVYDKAKPIIEWCHNKGITIACYTTLASIIYFPRGPVDVVVKRIAEELDATEDQVLMKWAYQVTYGGIIVTTSCKKESLQGQIRAFSDMKDLSHVQIQAIIDAGKGMHQRVYEHYMDDE
ncbi:hypothetical protein QFC21_000515 [Naganishia friedmannii]|uniref:Uncharacterized protein n=1 Tax=Naganishia friedmannii TaxID=89922 RepID=A0ACC2WDQ5_9TREE|nr:hypothetical protein QFC21_000515 [Naganishia friedmannii]